jgi:hypothetical protein
MGGVSDLLIDVEDALNEMHSRDVRPKYKQALKELKTTPFKNRWGEEFTLGNEAKDYMDAVLENKGKTWSDNWTDDEDEDDEADEDEEENVLDEVPKTGTHNVRETAAAAPAAEGKSGEKKRDREEEDEAADRSRVEPAGVSRQKQRNATYEAEMRLVLARIGAAIHEAMSGNVRPGLEIESVSNGAWNALVAHLLGPCIIDPECIELKRSELLEYFEQKLIDAEHCIPGTSKRYICKKATFSWKATPSRTLPIDQRMTYGLESEHIGRLTTKLKVTIRSE